jgi:hypothetical protein
MFPLALALLILAAAPTAIEARQSAPGLGIAEAAPASTQASAESAAVGPERPLRDAIHRIEVRFGAYPPPSFSSRETTGDVHERDADMGLAVDYLRSVTRDLAVGVSASSLVRSTAVWIDSDHNGTADDDRERTRTSHSTTFIYGVVRWNFARGLTQWRTLEPYVTGSAGPVFRWNQRTVKLDDDERDRESTEKTGFGGRVAAGFDVHLGRIFTLGAVGAWNWSTCEDETVGYGSEDRGGEVAVTIGFVWGWPNAAKVKK